LEPRKERSKFGVKSKFHKFSSSPFVFKASGDVKFDAKIKTIKIRIRKIYLTESGAWTDKRKLKLKTALKAS